MGHGLELDEVKGALNTAGFWTVATIKTLFNVAIPIVVLSFTVGFMKKVVKMGTDMGSD
tara:strand:- start:3241 stop:3417 length:177 start_codon:yes stop_codon:yes gene_type:complete